MKKIKIKVEPIYKFKLGNFRSTLVHKNKKIYTRKIKHKNKAFLEIV